MSYSVYKIEFPDKSTYIGMSKDVERRINDHKKTNHAGLLPKVEEYGINDEFVSILKTFKTKKSALDFEKKSILQHQYSCICLNGNSSGEEFPYIGISIDNEIKNRFQKLCKEMGSNISVEIRRFILQQLNEAGKWTNLKKP